MKVIILTIFFFLLTSLSVYASKVTLQWDANNSAEQIQGYNIYVDNTKVKEVLEPTAIVTVEPGQHSFQISSKNLWGESGLSETISTPPKATVPSGIKVITVTTTIQMQ